MKRLLVLLATVLAFTLTSVAQTSSGTSTTGQSDQTTTSATGQSDQTTTTTKSSKTKSGKSSAGKAKKESTLTGCLSAQPDADGMYTLSNSRHKKGVEVGPSDKVKDHAGHQVALKGQWTSGAAAGENAGGGTSAASKEKGEKHFEVASLKHIADTCKEAPGGGTTGATKKGKKKGAAAGGDMGNDTGASSGNKPPQL